MKLDMKHRPETELHEEQYYQQERMPSGMTAEFGFSWDIRTESDELIIYPFLTVWHKRKKRWPDDPSETTGRDGLQPAVWALQILEEVAKFYLERYEQVRVCVSWEDARRRTVYGKVLGKRGYYFTQWDGEKVLERVYTK